MLKSTYEKYKHLINTQINNWTILDITEHYIGGRNYMYAKCKCSCGTVKDVRLSVLLNNKCVDCGCGSKERHREKIKEQYEHLIGSQINGWTVLEILPPDNSHHHTFAICKCRCGTIKNVNIAYLLHGQSKDCGCGRKRTLKNIRTKDLVGQRFGKLVVIEALDERNNNGRYIYRCKCDCGNEVDVLAYSLTTGHTLSCGCLSSYWNMYIRQFLTQNNILFEAEYPVLIGGVRLRYDFYLPKYNLFIEYDGKQHYEPVRFFGTNEDAERSFKTRQKYDEIKNQYCKEHNINLLRIPYWETKNIETIINNHLQRLSVKGLCDEAS